VFPHLHLFHSPSSWHTAPILQSCLSLLIAKSMFKEVSRCTPLWVYFTLISYSSITLPYPFPSTPH
jgi:hypothetical protein